ncbi:hypothetical protein GCM10028805_44930 [Spirosoma harenae]
MRLKNSLSHDLAFYYCDFNSDYIDLYWLDSTKNWQHQRAGDLIPYNQLPIYKGHREQYRFFFRLASGQEITFYERAENVSWHPSLIYISPQLQTEKGRIESAFQTFVQDKGWKDYLLEGIIIGILFLAALYNIFLFFSINERVYLYFGICLIFFILDRNIYRIQHAFFDEFPYEFKLASIAFFILFFIFFIQSIRKLLQPTPDLRRINTAIAVSLALTALSNVVQLYSFRQPIVPLQQWAILIEVLIRIVFALCILMAIRMIKKGSSQARYVLLAISPLFIFWSFTLATRLLREYANYTLPEEYYPNHEYTESTCFAWMIIVFSGTLIHRFNLIRRQVAQQAIEKEQLEKEREIERSRLIAAQNQLLEKQVNERTAELTQSLHDLKAAQAQLIQKEKLASLGELTAGIAHEIQNPLNFVNNFSEVSSELVDELKDGPLLALPDTEKDYAIEIISDLSLNLQKITHHGKRADSIVKGMLEHSRARSGEKQPTDLNALVDEYLRLAYHGLKGKDKSFNAALKLDLNSTVGTVQLVPQDIGRVLLNIYTNAFYAVQEKQKQDLDSYRPQVSVTTLSAGDSVVIRINDNGTGIPSEIIDKIYQPFFTTKPTGQGTGLGLSLSYDIITKGHGGKIEVQTTPNEGTEFVITLPK